jgi:uncharacterized protein (DUF2267 family)
MDALGLKLIDAAVQDASRWVNEVDDRLDWEDRQRSYRALRAVLHAVRDHLEVDEATDFGAALPTIVRGIYYEGWNSARNPLRMRRAADFVAAVQAAYGTERLPAPERAIRAVFEVLGRQVSEGGMEDLRQSFTREVRALLGEE